MKKKLLIGLIILVGCFFIYKVAYKVYKQYTFNKITENVEKVSNWVIFNILNDGEDELKTNDLIYVCELRKALWNTGVNVDTIQILAERNNQNYKRFSEKMHKVIHNSEYVIKHSYGNKVDYKKSDVIGVLCTLVFEDTQISRSLYNKLLSIKYQNDTGSIGDVEGSRITAEDFEEYRKAKIIEDKLRLQF